MPSLGDLTVTLGAETSEFRRDMRSTEGTIRKTDRSMTALVSSAKRIGVGVGAAGAAMGAMGAAAIGIVDRAGAAAREVKNLAQISNTSTREFQRNVAAARSVGVEQGKLADIYKDMNDRVGDFLETGAGPMADFFENIGPKVGVTAEQFQNLSGPDALQLFVDSLEKANISQERMTFYMEQIASDSTKLIPLLRDGGKAMRELGDRAEESGQVMSEMEIEQLDEAKQRIDDLKASLGREFTRIVADNAEEIANLAESVGSAASAALSGAEAFGKFFGILEESPRMELLGERMKLDSQINALEKQLERRSGGVQNRETQEMEDRLARLRTELEEVDKQIQGDTITGGGPELRRPDVQLDTLDPARGLGEIGVNASRDRRADMDQMPGGPGDVLRKQAEDRLDVLRESMETEAEIEMERHENNLEILRNALEQEVVAEQEYNELKRETEKDHQEKMKAIRLRGLSDLEKFQAMSFKNQTKTVTNELVNMTAGVSRENKKMFQLNKAAGIANAIVSAYEGISKTLGAYPYPINIGMAAAHAASAFAQVKAIESQTFGGGGGAAPSLAGGTAAEPTSPVGGGGQQGQLLVIQGLDPESLISGKMARQMANEISNVVKDGGEVVFQ